MGPRRAGSVGRRTPPSPAIQAFEYPEIWVKEKEFQLYLLIQGPRVWEKGLCFIQSFRMCVGRRAQLYPVRQEFELSMQGSAVRD